MRLAVFRQPVTVDYQPMTVAKLAAFVGAEADFDTRWRLVVEFLPFDTQGARPQALVHAPAAFRRRGVFVADYEIDAA